MNFGRIPVGFIRPTILPFSIPVCSKVKMSCMHDHVAFHALDLGDVGDPARAILHAVLLHDQIDRGGDLLADSAHRQDPCPPSSTSSPDGRACRAGCWRGPWSSIRRGRCSWPGACPAPRRRGTPRPQSARGAYGGS